MFPTCVSNFIRLAFNFKLTPVYLPSSVPDSDTLAAMKRREHSLQHTKLAQRAYSLPCSDRRAVTHAVALRVVREFGLPDTTVEILQSARALYMEEPLLEVPRFIHHPRVALPVSRPHLHERCIRHAPSNPVSPARSYSPIEVGRHIVPAFVPLVT